MTGPPPPEVANAAPNGARRMRGEWLIAVAEGVLDVMELLGEAQTTGGRPLRRLRLVQVLSALPDWSVLQAEQTVEQLCARHGHRGPPGRMTVGWVVSARSDGCRVQGLCDLLADRVDPIWSDFPATRYEGATTT